MRAWLTRKRLVQLGIWIVVVLLGVELTWVPNAHDVHTQGALAITGIRIADGDTRVNVLRRIRPSMSLADIRCQIWQAARSGDCPDAATLSLYFWPQLVQSPKTLYVGVSTDCAEYDYVYGFNVEYLPSIRTLTIHCYSAAPWIFVPVARCSGMCPIGPLTVLVLVPTDAISPGSLTVTRDDRVEHLMGDQSTNVKLGALTVS